MADMISFILVSKFIKRQGHWIVLSSGKGNNINKIGDQLHALAATGSQTTLPAPFCMEQEKEKRNAISTKWRMKGHMVQTHDVVVRTARSLHTACSAGDGVAGNHSGTNGSGEVSTKVASEIGVVLRVDW